MNNLSTIQQIAIWVLPVLFAVTVHEVAHGWIASKLGDKTAFIMGRLTLNPLKHIDLVGTILVPAFLLLISHGRMVFGWAKPVPVNFANLHKPRRDMALVAAAGPSANFIMAIMWALIAKISIFAGTKFPMLNFFAYMGHAGIWINLILMVLNLIPIPPLDGSRVVSGFLPDRTAMKYNRIEPYGFFILIFLLATGILGRILLPIVAFLFILLKTVFGI